METPHKFILLIATCSIRSLLSRRLQRNFFKDLLHEQIMVIPFPQFATPFLWRESTDWLLGLDLVDLACPSYKTLQYSSDWPEVFADWRHRLDYMLSRYTDRGESRTVVILAPVSEQRAFHLPHLQDFLRHLEPAAIVELRIGEADGHITEQVPHAIVLNYPEDRSALLRLLRSAAGETIASQLESFSERHAMVRRVFADRTAEQELPKITVAYPESVTPSCWSTLEVFLYLRDYRELVQKEIKRLQARKNIDYSGVSSEFPKSLPVGCPIRISLQSNSLRTNPSELTINWYEPYNRLPFRISPIDDNRDGYSTSLDVDVFADDLPVASMRLAIVVNSNSHHEHATPAASDAAWYKDIFASYAREDLEIVKHLKERYEALGLYMFIDLDDLRSGASWQTALKQQIDSSDLFQLFWSDHASRSKYVALEWKHALRACKTKGESFIRPFYWHDPMPPVPKELAEINFRRISFVKS